jgi:hypothetical protein
MRGHTAQQELVEAELAVKRAAAAVAEEQREANKAAYKEAKRVGRALSEEYTRLEALFRTSERTVIEYQLAFSSVNGKAARLVAAEEADEFSNDDEEKAWLARGLELQAENKRLLAELNSLGAERDRLRLQAVKAYNALEAQRHSIRNLKNRLEDPEGDWMRRGVSPVDTLPNL